MPSDKDCTTCAHFHATREYTGYIGECRINPPRVARRRWPLVKVGEVCGKHTSKSSGEYGAVTGTAEIIKTLACQARREGDEMVCARCHQRWDVSDFDAPTCKN